MSSASRLRWKSIAASTWAVCGESTNAANCAIAGSSGNCARTDSQSAASKSGIVGAVASVASVAADSGAVERRRRRRGVGGRSVGVAGGQRGDRDRRKAGAEEGTAGGCGHAHIVRARAPSDKHVTGCSCD